MASWTQEASIRATDTDLKIRETRTWTEITFQLDSQAEGETKFGYKGKRSVIEPGTVYRMIVAPGTNIEAQTTSSSPVRISMWFTELEPIDQVLSLLCRLAGVSRG